MGANLGSVPREPGIGEKVSIASDKVNICISLAETIKRKLFSEEPPQTVKCNYEDCLQGNIESIRDRLIELENMLTFVSDRL